MYEWVLNTLLEGFVLDAPWEELAAAPVVECLTATAWQNYHQQISRKWTLRLKLTFLMTFPRLEEYEHTPLRKDQFTAYRAL